MARSSSSDSSRGLGCGTVIAILLIAFVIGCITGYLPEEACQWFTSLAQWFNDLFV